VLLVRCRQQRALRYGSVRACCSKTAGATALCVEAGVVEGVTFFVRAVVTVPGSASTLELQREGPSSEAVTARFSN
jgi:hypothetical protein